MLIANGKYFQINCRKSLYLQFFCGIFICHVLVFILIPKLWLFGPILCNFGGILFYAVWLLCVKWIIDNN